MKPLMMMSSILFLLFHHPISMIMSLMATTIFSALLITNFSNISWFSYIISLIMVGAMLIIFIYLASLAPNETFPKNLVLTLTISLLIIFFTWPLPSTTPSLNPSFTLTKQLFSSIQLIPTILLAIFLFMTMIVVVKITTISSGPLKSSKI